MLGGTLGRSSRGTTPVATGSTRLAKTIGIVRVSRWRAAATAVEFAKNIGLQADQLLRERSYPVGVAASPTKVNLHVAAFGPTQIRKRLRERRKARSPHGIVFVSGRGVTGRPCYLWRYL
jgi:hypothetical protein